MLEKEPMTGWHTSPSADQIKAVRQNAKLSRKEAAAMLHASVRTWEKWEVGERRMHPAFWELFKTKVLMRSKGF